MPSTSAPASIHGSQVVPENENSTAPIAAPPPMPMLNEVVSSAAPTSRTLGEATLQQAGLQQGGDSAEGGAPHDERDDDDHGHPREERQDADGEDDAREHPVQPAPRVPPADHAREHETDGARTAVEEEQDAERPGLEARGVEHERRDVRVEDVVARHDDDDEQAHEEHRGHRGVAAHGHPDLARRERDAVVDGRQEGDDRDDEHHHDRGDDAESRPPAECEAERRAQRHTEHEGDRAARARDGDRAGELVARHEVGGVGAGDRPEEAVGEPAQHARAHEHLVAGREGREHVGEREHSEHGQQQPLARVVPGEGRERRRREHDGAREDGDEQADLRLGDGEVGGHDGQQAGRQELARDEHEDRGGEGDEPDPGERAVG